MRNWYDLSYLKQGTAVQQEVYDVMIVAGVMDDLAEFSPVLAGTFPIGINIPGSDLDIICAFDDKNRFMKIIRERFADKPGFSLNEKNKRGLETVIARFEFRAFIFEIFGQPVPVKDQYAYRHMIIENTLLEERGEAFRKQILDLKIKGHSTEQAFAIVLGIKGDAYEGLLDYEI